MVNLHQDQTRADATRGLKGQSGHVGSQSIHVGSANQSRHVGSQGIPLSARAAGSRLTRRGSASGARTSQASAITPHCPQQTGRVLPATHPRVATGTTGPRRPVAPATYAATPALLRAATGTATSGAARTVVYILYPIPYTTSRRLEAEKVRSLPCTTSLLVTGASSTGGWVGGASERLSWRARAAAPRAGSRHKARRCGGRRPARGERYCGLCCMCAVGRGL